MKKEPDCPKIVFNKVGVRQDSSLRLQCITNTCFTSIETLGVLPVIHSWQLPVLSSPYYI